MSQRQRPDVLATGQKRRCAVYTRKSTEEGLDREFNTLDAQRDACMGYVARQRADGWKSVADDYDDGGFAGANLDRSALRRLLADIERGLVDVIVGYKIDRLSCSLMDFTKLVEVFDAHGVTFVSVTPSFDTKSSMGRLTLNILLSFAQFEREVIIKSGCGVSARAAAAAGESSVTTLRDQTPRPDRGGGAGGAE